MILFWLVCAAFIVIALAFIMPTALQRDEKSRGKIADERRLANIAIYRDQLSELDSDLQNGIVSQEQYTQDREEIQRRLLEDTATVSTKKDKSVVSPSANRGTAYLLAFSLPLIAVIFYLEVGSPNSIAESAAARAPAATASGDPTQAQIEGRVAALAKRLQANPSDAEGWTMLARSYNSMERFGEAAGAYAKAVELQPKNADLLAEYAFVSAMANGQKWEGQPAELLNQALKLDPENAKALQLAGFAAFDAKNYKKAIEYWQHFLKKVPEGSEVAQAINERLDEAKSLAGPK